MYKWNQERTDDEPNEDKGGSVALRLIRNTV